MPKEETEKYLEEIDRLKLRVTELEARKDCAKDQSVGDSTFRKIYETMTEGSAVRQCLLEKSVRWSVHAIRRSKWLSNDISLNPTAL